MENKEKQFGKIEKRMPIIVKGIIFKKKRLLDIRKYYIDKNGDVKPLHKGISLGYEDFEAVLDILKKNEEDIMEYLEVDES